MVQRNKYQEGEEGGPWTMLCWNENVEGVDIYMDKTVTAQEHRKNAICEFDSVITGI